MQGETIPIGPTRATVAAVTGAFFKGLAGAAEPHAPVTRPAPATRTTPDAVNSPIVPMVPPVGPPVVHLGRKPGRPRIVFVVMSAVAQAGTVDQLAQALAPHPVLVHHDFSQTPNFTLNASNVRFVPDPVRTGWAQFGFVEGIFHAMQYAFDHLDFDYLQLLSPTCLPIKPMAEFEHHISGLEEAHFDCVDLITDRDALLCVGYRAWTAEGSLMHRVMRRLSDIYFDGSPGRRDEAGIWLRSSAGLSLGSQLVGLVLRQLAHSGIGRHLRQQHLRLYYGSTWFGARRHIIAGMLRIWRQPGVREHFSQVRIAEEFLIPSLLMKLRPHKGPLHHLIQRFDQAHPGRFTEADWPRLRQSRAFFARKFADDPQSPLREQVLRELAQAPAHTDPSTTAATPAAQALAA